MILNVEADEVAYRCAFAHDKQGYIYKGVDGTEFDLGADAPKTEIIRDLALNSNEVHEVDYTLEPYRYVSTEDEVVKDVHNRMQELSELVLPTGEIVKEVRLYLSPSDHSNFRYKVADTIGPKGVGYKAGRPAKPTHIKLIRQIMIEEYGAVEITGYEADDALGIYQTPGTIACHIDKDINMIPGNHYDHVNNLFYTVSYDTKWFIQLTDNKKVKCNATLFFYVQMLVGDATDNIPGCKHPDKSHHKKPPCISVKEAVMFLEKVKDEQQAYAVIKNMYIHTYGEMWEKHLAEVADLVWICRNFNETGSVYLRNKGLL